MEPPNREPSDREASNREVVVFEERSWLATFYPQMGGYGGKCWVDVTEGVGACFDVYVYHDGEFPFAHAPTKEPIRLHHCAAQQFRRFADEVETAQGRVG